MALELQSQRVVDFIAKLGLPDVSESTPAEARRLSSLRMENLPPGPEATVTSLTIPGAEDGDGSRIAVGGDSAGGNLAAVTSMLARDRNGPALRLQLLVYPATDMTRFDRPSTLQNATGYFLTRAAMMWFTSQYAPAPKDAANPYASPLLATDLHGLPPALVITAEHDPCATKARPTRRACKRRASRRRSPATPARSTASSRCTAFSTSAGALTKKPRRRYVPRCTDPGRREEAEKHELTVRYFKRH